MSEVFAGKKISHSFLLPTLKGYEICTEPQHEIKDWQNTR
jgi:hypothetical protein